MQTDFRSQKHNPQLVKVYQESENSLKETDEDNLQETEDRQ